MKNLIAKFWNEEEGLTAVEYAVAGGVIVVGLVLAFTNLGNAVLGRDVFLRGVPAPEAEGPAPERPAIQKPAGPEPPDERIKG